jgi:hypothetical protein
MFAPVYATKPLGSSGIERSCQVLADEKTNCTMITEKGAKPIAAVVCRYDDDGSIVARPAKLFYDTHEARVLMGGRD